MRRTVMAAVLGAVALAVALTGCFSSFMIERADSGGVRTVEVGDLLLVRLPGNPSTGYMWRVAEESAPGVLELEGEPRFDPEYPNVCGSPGTYTFRFRARAAGTTRLVLVYERTWEQDVLDTFEILVISET